MPFRLVRSILLCLLVAAPAIVLRATGSGLSPVTQMLLFGAAVIAASFLLAWAAEAAQKDISGALAIALLALIAVLPEYAVDLYYAYRAGSDPAYVHFAAANMTGSNRLLLGFGWPLVVIIALLAARGSLPLKPQPTFLSRSLKIPIRTRLDVGFLAFLSIGAFAIPLIGAIPVWIGLVLISVFGTYLWRAGQTENQEEVELVGTAGLIGQLSKAKRRSIVIAMFVVSAGIILACAEPFAEALVHSGAALGIDSYFLVQWIAPLASESPEFVIAIMFALRGHGGAAIATLIASKVNQWSLLVGSLPLAYLAGGGDAALPLDARQVEEFVLTATQSLLGVAIILSLRFKLWTALLLAGLFLLQFFIIDTGGRYILSVIQAVLAIGFIIANRRDVSSTLVQPFRRQIMSERLCS